MTTNLFVRKFFALGLFVAVVAACLFSPGAASGSGGPETPSVLNIYQDSDVIVVAEIRQYIPDPTKVISLPIPGWASWGLMYMNPIKLPGHYHFTCGTVIKGKVPHDLNLDIGYISSSVYGTFDAWLPVKFDVGTRVLLFLKDLPGKGIAAANGGAPFLPLAPEATLSPLADAPTIDHVVHLLLTSLTDPVLRRINTRFLRTVVNKQLPIGLAPYVNDPDPSTQDNVLYCLGANQQVAVIPIMAKIDRTRELGECVTVLGRFETPEAEPYLLPLLFSQHYYTRLNARMTTGKFSTRANIPYDLMNAWDPDWQGFLTFGAYLGLQMWLPGVQPIKVTKGSEFVEQRETLMKPYLAWWADEMRGRHLPKGDVAPPLPAAATPVEKLNPLLFDPHAAVRRKTLALLDAHADETSIPYLILTVRDPDAAIASTAYAIAHRLVGSGPTYSTATQFEAHRAEAVDFLTHWWSVKISKDMR